VRSSVEITPKTDSSGALIVSGSSGVPVLTTKFLKRNDYSGTSVTTGAYVQLFALTSAAVKALQIFDSSGSALVLAIGGSGSEVDSLYIFPGGNGDVFGVDIPAGSRVSVKAVDTNATSGQLLINFFG
jgi:hypothetical protein